MLPIKKIYIDSRHATKDSKDSSNFKIELPNTYAMPSDTVFFITDVCIPHSWRTIETDINDRMYFTTDSNYYIAVMTSGVYDGASFASALQTAINAVVSNISVSYGSSFNTLIISSNLGPLKIYTDEEVPIIDQTIKQASGNWIGATYNGGLPNSINDNIQNFIPQVPGVGYKCDFLNLQNINNVYITSPSLGSFDTMSSFSQNIIKKVPVTANYGYMIFDNSMTTNDFLNCSHQTLKTIEFHLKDSRGRYINLHNAHVTFSIIFNKYNINV